MSDNKKLILKEFESLKGQFVIACDWKIKRLIGVIEDDMDYYWVLYDGRNYSLDSCLCKLVKVKGKIDKKDYNEFVRLAYLNHFDLIPHEISDDDKQKEIEFIINHKHSIISEIIGSGENRLISDVCWELNKID